MKIKAALLGILFLLLLVSIAEIVIPFPSAETLYPFAKSGYFDSLDQSGYTIAAGFTSVKAYARTEFAYAYLDDISKSLNMPIVLFDRTGHLVRSYGTSIGDPAGYVKRVIDSNPPMHLGYISQDRYYSVIPILYEERCLICHPEGKAGSAAGAIVVGQKISSAGFVSRERRLVFLFVSIVLFCLIFLSLKWDPDKPVRELFDK